MNLPIRSNPPEGESLPVVSGPRSYAIQTSMPGQGGGFGAPPYRAPEEEPPVFVLADLRVAAGFPWRSLRRHRALATWIFSGLLCAVAAAIAVTPKHYRIETSFAAEKNFLMPALGNPKRAIPRESDSPTRLASETVLRRSNLTEIIRQTKLLAAWDQMRSPLGKAKDAVVVAINGPLTDADKLDAYIGLLEKRMTVASTLEGTVTIELDWPDPLLGYRIVQAAQQNFFEQRHAEEVSLIGESIGILEAKVSESEQAIQSALSQIRTVTPIRSVASAPLPVFGPPRPAAPSAAVTALQAELRSKRQVIDDITASRSARVAALQTRLQEMKGMYGSAHPEVTSTEENLRTLSVPSAQIETLHQEEAAIRARLVAAGGTDGAVAASTTREISVEPTFAREALESIARLKADTAESPEVTVAKSRLKIATTAYEDMLDRLEGAKIEMETARAAFKYRYSVITPARIPKKADKPKIPLLVIGGFILSAMLTVFAVIVIDFAGGRVLEAWQVDRQLGLPVIAEVRRR